MVVTRWVKSWEEGYGEDALRKAYDDTNDNAENDQPLRKYAPEELFSEAARRADLACGRDRQPDIKTFGNVLWSVGVPGIGKKTLGRQLLECVLEEQQLNEFCYIFCISLTEDRLRTLRQLSLLQFLCLGVSIDYDKFRWAESIIENEILYTSDDVYIFVDTLPKLPPIIWDNVSEAYTANKMSAAFYLRAILSNEIFPKAKKYIAMQIKEFCLLPYRYRPAFLVKVLGLGNKEQKKLIMRCCNDQRDSMLFDKMLRNYSELSVFLHNPSCCKALATYCFSVFSKMTKHEQSNRFFVLVSSLICMLTDDNAAIRKAGKLYSAFSCLCRVAVTDILERFRVLSQYTKHKFCKWYCKETGETLAVRSESLEKIVFRSMEKFFNVYVEEKSNPLKRFPCERLIYSTYSYVSSEWTEVFSAFSLRFETGTSLFNKALLELTQRDAESNILNLLYFSFDSHIQDGFKYYLFPEIAEDYWGKEREKQMLVQLRKVAFQSSRITNVEGVFRKCRWARASQDREILDDLRRALTKAPVELHGRITASEINDIRYVVQHTDSAHGQRIEFVVGCGTNYAICVERSLGALLEALDPSALVVVSKDLRLPLHQHSSLALK